MHRDSLLNAVRAVLSGTDRQRTAHAGTFLDSASLPSGSAPPPSAPHSPVDVHLVLNALALLRNRCGPSNPGVASMIDAVSGHLGEGSYLARRRYQSTVGHLEHWCHDTLLLIAASRGQRAAIRFSASAMEGRQVYELSDAVALLSRLFRVLDAQADRQDADVHLGQAGDDLLIDVHPLPDEAVESLVSGEPTLVVRRNSAGGYSLSLALRPVQSA